MYVEIILILSIPFAIGLIGLICRWGLRKHIVHIYLALCGPIIIVILAKSPRLNITALSLVIIIIFASFISMLLFNILLRKMMSNMIYNIGKWHADWIDIACVSLCNPGIVWAILFIAGMYIRPQQEYIWI